MVRTSLFAAGALALFLASPAAAGGFADEIVEAPLVVVEPQAPRGSLPGWVIPAVLVAGLVALAVSGDDSEDDEGFNLSDARLKTDITRIGTAPNGLPVYSFRYLGGETLHSGVMAQDVLEVAPDAVRVGPLGYYEVDYDRLGLEMQTLD